MFEHVGFAVPRILELATSAAAAAVGLGDRTGRLLPGYDADLAVVAGDPLTDLQSLRDVRLVMARGRPHIPTAVALKTGRVNRRRRSPPRGGGGG